MVQSRGRSPPREAKTHPSTTVAMSPTRRSTRSSESRSPAHPTETKSPPAKSPIKKTRTCSKSPTRSPPPRKTLCGTTNPSTNQPRGMVVVEERTTTTTNNNVKETTPAKTAAVEKEEETPTVAVLETKKQSPVAQELEAFETKVQQEGGLIDPAESTDEELAMSTEPGDTTNEVKTTITAPTVSDLQVPFGKEMGGLPLPPPPGYPPHHYHHHPMYTMPLSSFDGPVFLEGAPSNDRGSPRGPPAYLGRPHYHNHPHHPYYPPPPVYYPPPYAYGAYPNSEGNEDNSQKGSKTTKKDDKKKDRPPAGSGPYHAYPPPHPHPFSYRPPPPPYFHHGYGGGPPVYPPPFGGPIILSDAATGTLGGSTDVSDAQTAGEKEGSTNKSPTTTNADSATAAAKKTNDSGEGTAAATVTESEGIKSEGDKKEPEEVAPVPSLKDIATGDATTSETLSPVPGTLPSLSPPRIIDGIGWKPSEDKTNLSPSLSPFPPHLYGARSFPHYHQPPPSYYDCGPAYDPFPLGYPASPKPPFPHQYVHTSNFPPPPYGYAPPPLHPPPLPPKQFATSTRGNDGAASLGDPDEDPVRRSLKNEQSRSRAAALRERLKHIATKPEWERTYEEKELVRKDEERRTVKNQQSKERSQKKRDREAAIAAKAPHERTAEEAAWYDHQTRKRRHKAEGDKLRRKRIKQLGLPVKNTGKPGIPARGPLPPHYQAMLEEKAAKTHPPNMPS